MEEDRVEQTLERALQTLKKETRGAMFRMALAICSWALALLLAILGAGLLTSGVSAGMVALFLSLPCILLGALASSHPAPSPMDSLLLVADARAVGPLLDLLPGAFAGRRKAICSLLTRLLPHLGDGDSHRLSPSHHAQLRTALLLGDFEQDREFLIAILKALERIGETADLMFVERMAGGESVFAAERRVREAARAVLPHLRRRIERQKHHDGLLRPACNDAPDDLLHPAYGETETDPGLLLRPGTAPLPKETCCPDRID